MASHGPGGPPAEPATCAGLPTTVLRVKRKADASAPDLFGEDGKCEWTG